MVLDMDLLTLNFKNETHLESLFLLYQREYLKSGLYAYHDQIQATNKFYLGALILSDTVLESNRKIKSDIELIMIGPHENYYKELKSYLKRR